MRTVIIFFKNLVRYIGIKIFKNKSLVLSILFLAIAIAAFYFYDQNRKAQVLLNNPAQTTENETNKLIEEIGALMVLPEGEKPTLISVVDKEKVKDQPFFAKAENGDKVLVYTAAKKAILYRPSNKKIIEIGPVDIAPEKTFKVALYNATTNSTKLDDIEKTLKDKITNLEYPIKERAASNTTDILVIDIVGDKKTEAEQMAKLLEGTVTSLPVAEKKPDADFLIIVGK